MEPWIAVVVAMIAAGSLVVSIFALIDARKAQHQAHSSVDWSRREHVLSLRSECSELCGTLSTLIEAMDDLIRRALADRLIDGAELDQIQARRSDKLRTIADARAEADRDLDDSIQNLDAHCTALHKHIRKLRTMRSYAERRVPDLIRQYPATD